ncbi:MAG: transcriptional regulator [Puniceicoccaceae bacterium]|nr:MAG: transcriptional regulator [Puniceicoccaceae bacterium]
MSMATTETNLDIDRLAKQLWALGDPVRLQILQILPTEPTCHNACNVSKIAERIGLSQPSASHHLRILRQAGIIVCEKKCRDRIYWIDLEAAAEVKAELGEILS